MTELNNTVTFDHRDVCELLSKAESQLSFVQSITLLDADESLTLESYQVTGLFHVLETIRTQIEEASKQIYLLGSAYEGE